MSEEHAEAPQHFVCPYCAGSVRMEPGGIGRCGGCGYVRARAGDPMMEEGDAVFKRVGTAAMILPVAVFALAWRWHNGR